MNALRFQTACEMPPDCSFDNCVTVSNRVPSSSFLHTCEIFQYDASAPMVRAVEQTAVYRYETFFICHDPVRGDFSLRHASSSFSRAFHVDE
jgi:hypothetical protein